MRTNFLANIPPVVRGLLIINIAVFVLDFFVTKSSGTPLVHIGGLHYFKSDFFKPFQIITHMFMHGGLTHLLFNMYALWMFGQILERVWGPKRFFIYYIVAGLGAASLQMLVYHFQIQSAIDSIGLENADKVIRKGADLLLNGQNWSNPAMGDLNLLYNFSNMVGASGAVMGLLLAFGMLFPNTELQLIFIPIPIKAKYFVIFYGVIELFLGTANFQWDNIAHFAHLGGMIFGFILIKIWGTSRTKFY